MATKTTSATKAANKTFHVTGRVTVETDVTVYVPSWEDAIACATRLKVTDFVTLAGDHIDSSNPIIKTIWIDED